MPDPSLAADRWNAEYARGRYQADPPVAFVDDILAARPTGTGLYLGCGNGRNVIPLVDAGLNLIGIDIAEEAIRQLADRRPDLAPRLEHADLHDLDANRRFDYVIAIQVLQHGTDATLTTAIDRIATMIMPGGLFFLRTNAASTEIFFAHDVIERNRWGGYTIRYADGPKTGLPVHFATAEELIDRLDSAFSVEMPPRDEVIQRDPPQRGTWSQWDGIWRRRT